MAAQTPLPVTHVYKEVNEGKYKTVKHYELIEVIDGTSLLSELINISEDRKCAKSSPKFWLQIREGNKWVKPRLTGLFKTTQSNIYKGDTQRRKNLLVFNYIDGGKTLVVKYFKDYFTGDLNNVSEYLNI
jgi:hypothetical protein